MDFNIKKRISIRKKDSTSVNLLDKWKNIFQYTKWGVGTGSLDGVIEMVNPVFARMHGYRVEELVGKPVAILFAEEERKYLPQIFDKIHKEGYYFFECRHVRRDGSTFLAIVEANTIYKDGQPQYRVVNVEDITEQKLTQQKLQESEEKYRALFHKANDDILVYEVSEDESSGKFINVNSTACQRYGYSQEEFMEMSMHDLKQHNEQKKN